jgi:predicted ATP-dependent serine protease
MVYGSPGSGKSTFVIQFQKYLASNHDLKILFWAKEEGVSQTLKEKLQRLDAFDKNIFITEGLPKDLSSFDALVIDSVNDARLAPEDIAELQTKYPDLSLILIFQATKEGKFKGLNEWEHWVQSVIQIKNGKAITGKNRFGANGEIDVF